MKADLNLRKPLDGAVLEVKLTITKEFKLRMWIGKHLLIWAGKVLGAEIELVTPPQAPPAIYGTECKIDGVLTTADAGKFTDTMRKASNAISHAFNVRNVSNVSLDDVHALVERRARNKSCETLCAYQDCDETCPRWNEQPHDIRLRRINEQRQELINAATTLQQGNKPVFTATTGLPDFINPDQQDRRFEPFSEPTLTGVHTHPTGTPDTHPVEDFSEPCNCGPFEQCRDVAFLSIKQFCRWSNPDRAVDWETKHRNKPT